MKPTRLPLADVVLTGPRAWVRHGLTWGVVALSTIGALGYVLPAHRIDEDFHSNYADGGAASLLVFLIVGVFAVALRRRGFGAGFVRGLVAMAGAIGALLPVILVHFMQTVEDAPGETLFAIGVIGLFLVGAAALVSEPIFYLLERRRLRELEPVFAHARVVVDR